MEKEGKCLVKRHAFGARSDVKGSLCWLDDGTLMYPVGKAITLHTIATNNQRFLEASYQSSGATALAASANKKFIAVAEGGENPQIQIIDTTTRKRRKVLTVPDLGSDRFTAMAFSADGRHLVTQGGAPSWNLFYWNWERSKPLASVSIAAALEGEQGGTQHHPGSRTGGGGGGGEGAGTTTNKPPSNAGAALSASHGSLVSDVAVCPGDALTITVSGVGLLRFYRYVDGYLQPQPGCGYLREQLEVFPTHTWLDAERLLVSTQRSGGLILVEHGRYVGHIAVPTSISTASMTFTANEAVSAVVTSITPTRNGFVSGSSNGLVSVFEKNPNAIPGTGGAPPVRYSVDGDAEEEDSADGGGTANYLFECLCTLQVPEREPGEPTDLVPHRDPNSPITRDDPATAAARRRLGEAGAAAAAGSSLVGGASSTMLENTASVTTTTRSGKPRRFHVTPPPGGQSVLHSSGAHPSGSLSGTAAGQGRAGEADGAEAGRSTTSAVAAAAAAPGSSAPAQEAAGTVLGTVRRLSHGVAAMALDQGEETLAVLTNAGKIYALDFRQHWAQVQREIDSAVSRMGVTLPGNGTAAPNALGDSGSEGGIGRSVADGATGSAGVDSLGTLINGHGSSIPAFEPVCEPFHTGSINGMATSVRKPFLLTSSSDHSVRLWNTSTQKMEMCVFFREEPGAVALHPSGLMAVICFPDCVRVMSVLWNSLRDRRAINFRHASDVAFSHGGQFFSVTHGNLVDVYHSATCEPFRQLRGHPQKVKDLKWCSTSPYPTDNSLITCSMDGMIMYWSTQDAHKEAEHSDGKHYQYMAVAADDRYVWALGAPTSATALEVQWKVTLREMDRHVLGSANASSEDYEFTDTALTSLLVAPHQRMLLGGGEDGSLKTMSLPLAVGVQQAPLPAHASRITRMAVSHDESLVFTAGADGSIFIWEVRDGVSRAAVGVVGGVGAGGVATSALGGGGGADNFPYGTNEVLVTQQELEEQRVEMASLQQTMEKLKTDIDSEEKRRNHEQGTRMRERLEEFKGDAATLASEYAAVWNSKAEQERAFVAVKLEKEAEAASEMEQLETTRQAEVQTLEELCNDLQHTLEKEQTQHAEDLIALERQIEEEANADKERYQDLVSQREEVLAKLTRQAARAHQANQETLHQLELDTDAESQEVGSKHQRELNALRERFLHMKGEGAIMRKNATRMEREIDVRGGELKLLDSAKAALTAQLASLNQRVAQLHQDIDERDAVIGEKEKSIYALKKHNQELEKFKFVLDHRIRQLKAQMEPKQREIMQHNQQIKVRNGELETLHASNLTLRASIESLKADLGDQQQLTKQLLKAIKDFDTYKTRYLRDVGEIAPALQEPQRLREVVERLYATHVASRGGERVAAADPKIRQEFQEQLEYLSTSVGALRKKVKADQERHRKEVSAMMTENLTLIKEIHLLRAEIQELRTLAASEEAVRRARGSLSASAPAATAAASRGLRGGGRRQTNKEGERIQDTAHGTTADEGAAAAATTGPSPRRASATADKAGASSSKPRANPMPSATAPHPHPPTSGAVRGAGDSVRSSRRHGGGGGGGGGGAGKGSRAPEPPRAIEENKAELRMLRAYIEVLEKALSAVAAQRPPSTSGLAGGQRLPPIDLASSAETSQRGEEG